GIKHFLFGHSMGGAIAFYCALRAQEDGVPFDGIIMQAPMCKMSAKMYPPGGPEGIITKLFFLLADMFPELAVTPSATIRHLAFKLESARELSTENPWAALMKPRLRTAAQMLQFCKWVQDRRQQLKTPCLIMHGECDYVTDPSSSRELFAQCQSVDKTFRLFEGFWHCMTSGEAEQDREHVLGTIIGWLDERYAS
ncbi:hypothetical protein CYMTET_51913, partial [Cymbomonas tetramitiformis]